MVLWFIGCGLLVVVVYWLLWLIGWFIGCDWFRGVVFVVFIVFGFDRRVGFSSGGAATLCI